MADADRRTIEAGLAGQTLMEVAGRAVADCVATGWPGEPVTVLCGPGNNGGDGFVAARHLEERGHAVRVACLVERAMLKGDAAWAAGLWQGDVAAIDAIDIGTGVVIDALFGAGLDRPPEGPARRAIEAIEAASAPCVAVDVPSGVSGDSGAVRGRAPTCAATVTFFRGKPGHILYPGRARCGTLHIADIGISSRVLGATQFRALVNHPALWVSQLPATGWTDHKYLRGLALVLGGVPMTGAARLAALSAARVGAGMVRVGAPSAALNQIGAAAASLVLHPWDSDGDLGDMLRDTRLGAILLGPGLGKESGRIRETVAAVLFEARPTVLDADALTAFAGTPDTLFEALHPACILTPHEGEFSRVFPDLTDGSKLDRVQRAAERAGCIVLLKGPDTVIAGPGHKPVINTTGNARLATAGTGDVLAGSILGLIAGGMTVFDAGCAAAWLQGRAAERASDALIADDLPGMLGLVRDEAQDLATRVAPFRTGQQS